MRVQLSWLCLVAGTVLAAGCGQPPEAKFALHREKTETLIPEAKAEVEKALLDYFGTPHVLVGWQKFPIDYGEAESETAGHGDHISGWRLKDGRNLYMQHCQHCHGVAGDGEGPTARFLNPRPRDYRLGIFKFKSTQREAKPTAADLKHLLSAGIPGTYMPSFVLLGNHKLDLIVDYVRWLSIRGEFEKKLFDEISADGARQRDLDASIAAAHNETDLDKKKSPEEIKSSLVKSVKEEMNSRIETAATELAQDWADADQPENSIVPKKKRRKPTPESLENGRKLFLSLIPKKETKCTDCHGPVGRGDGPSTEAYWKIPGTTPERNYEVAGLHDDWGMPIQPRNLTRGLYRGGRRPIDLYRRIVAGIPGTPMAGFAKVLTDDDDIWDLVNYVLSIPFDGKHSAYPADVGDEEEKVAVKE